MLLAVLLCTGLLATACGDDDTDVAGDGTTSTSATAGDGDAVDPTSEVVDEAAGSFELTTADGSMAVAGTATDCRIGDDRSSLRVTFSGSSQDVDVDAADGGGSVTVTGEFEGRIDSMSIDDSGEVAISGTGTISDDSAEPTTFEVNGTCP